MSILDQELPVVSLKPASLHTITGAVPLSLTIITTNTTGNPTTCIGEKADICNKDMKCTSSERLLPKRSKDESVSDFAQCHRQSAVPRIPRANVVRKTLIATAQRILERVNEQFGIGDLYLDEVYGPKITLAESQSAIMHYMKSERFSKKIKVQWSSKISSSACLVSVKSFSNGRLRSTKYRLVINSDPLENCYLRKLAISSLADHELGTHYVSKYE